MGNTNVCIRTAPTAYHPPLAFLHLLAISVVFTALFTPSRPTFLALRLRTLHPKLMKTRLRKWSKNSIAFGSAPRREADSQPISQSARPAVSRTETHSLGFVSVADWAPSSGVDSRPQGKLWSNGNAANHRLFGRRFEPLGELLHGARTVRARCAHGSMFVECSPSFYPVEQHPGSQFLHLAALAGIPEFFVFCSDAWHR